MNPSERATKLHLLLEQRYQAGIRASEVTLAPDAIRYTDTDFQAEFSLADLDPDHQYDLENRVTEYLVHQDHRVQVNTEDQQGKRYREATLDTFEVDLSQYPHARTSGGHYLVYIKPAEYYHRPLIREADGATVDFNWHLPLEYESVATDDPMAPCRRHPMRVIAYSTPSPERPGRPDQPAQVRRVAARLFIEHVARRNESGKCYAWIPESIGQYLPEEVGHPQPQPVPTAIVYDEHANCESGLVRMPPGAVDAQFHHDHNSILIAAWQRVKPDGHTIIAGVTPNNTPLPILSLQRARITPKPGAEPFDAATPEYIVYQPPRAVSCHYQRVHAIVLTYQLTRPDGTTTLYTILSDTYAATDDANQMCIYVADNHQPGPADQNLKNIIRRHLPSSVADFANAVTDYHMRALTGDFGKPEDELANLLNTVLPHLDMHQANHGDRAE